MPGRALSPCAKMPSSTVAITACRIRALGAEMNMLLQRDQPEHDGGQSARAEPAHEQHRRPAQAVCPQSASATGSMRTTVRLSSRVQPHAAAVNCGQRRRDQQAEEEEHRRG